MSEVEAAKIAVRLDRLPRSWTIFKIVTLVSLAGGFEFYELFLTGYIAPQMAQAQMFSSASIGVFAELRSISVAGIGTFVFCTFAGMWAGVLIFSQCADWYGRRNVLTWSLMWYLGCSAIMAFQRSGQQIDIWRFMAGLGFSVQLVAIDAYICEIVPMAERGRAFALNQFITFCAVPIVAFLAWLLEMRQPWGWDGWRWVILSGSVGMVAIWAIRVGIPESPRWLALQGRVAEADAITTALERRVMAECGATVLAAPAAITPEQAGTGYFWEIFKLRYFERTIMLSVFNLAQVVGFYGFAAWVPTLLVARGVTISNSLEYSLIIAIADPIGPLLGILIGDKIGRKLLITIGLILMGLFIIIFSISSTTDLLIASGVLFTVSANMMSYAFHNYQAELFPTRIRARAIGFVYSWSRVAAAFSGFAVAFFLKAGGVPAVASFITAAMVIALVIIAVFGPQTNRRPLEKINH